MNPLSKVCHIKLFNPIRGEHNPAKDIIDFEYKYSYEKGNMYSNGILKGNAVTLSDGEEVALRQRYREYMLAGAKANRDSATAKCQYKVSEFYYGKSGFPQDYNMVRYWLMMAKSNNADVDLQLEAVERMLRN